MKSIISILLISVILIIPMESQNVGINNDGSLPDNSAGLDVKFTDKGFLPPRLSSEQISHITNPAEGLMVYNTNNKKPIYFDGTDWRYFDGTLFYVIPSTGLVAHYPFNGNANDLSINSNNGALINGVSTVNGRDGGANGSLHFDGTDDYVLVPNSGSLQSVTTQFTFSVWINIEDWYNSCCALILSKYLAPNENMRFFIYPSAIYYSMVEHFDLTSTITLGQWHHFVVTSDGTNVRVYQNGNFLGTCAMTATLVANSDVLEIGRDRPGGSTDFLNGTLDDLRIYNRALTDHEVQSLYCE